MLSRAKSASGGNTWLEIDLKAIVSNLQEIKKIIGWPKVKLMPVVKANAYGYGLVEVSRVSEKENVDYLAVSTIDEALKLRQNGINLPILIIGYIDQKEIISAINNKITLSFYDPKLLKVFEKAAKIANKPARVHLKIDTGMNRLGIRHEDFLAIYQNLIKNSFIKIEYLYSHFADYANPDFTNIQLERLKKILQGIRKRGLPLLKVHFCRSASLQDKRTHFEMVRPGLAIYGLAEIPGLKPALSLKTKIAQIKKIKKGEYVGYSLSFRAKTQMKIATIACGYADGYSRNLSNRGEVLIKGVRCQVIGRVCMNLTIVDVSKINPPTGGPKIGDEVVLIGKRGDKEITALELASKIDTIAYEIVSRLPEHLPRIYLH